MVPIIDAYNYHFGLGSFLRNESLSSHSIVLDEGYY
jgi:hypothetical protein